MKGNNKYFHEGTLKPREVAYIGAFLREGQKPLLHETNAKRTLKDDEYLDYHMTRLEDQGRGYIFRPERDDLWYRYCPQDNENFIRGIITAQRTVIIVTDIQAYGKDQMTGTMKEILWLKDNGYTFEVDSDPYKTRAIPPKTLITPIRIIDYSYRDNKFSGLRALAGIYRNICEQRQHKQDERSRTQPQELSSGSPTFFSQPSAQSAVIPLAPAVAAQDRQETTLRKMFRWISVRNIIFGASVVTAFILAPLGYRKIETPESDRLNESPDSLRAPTVLPSASSSLSFPVLEAAHPKNHLELKPDSVDYVQKMDSIDSDFRALTESHDTDRSAQKQLSDSESLIFSEAQQQSSGFKKLHEARVTSSSSVENYSSRKSKDLMGETSRLSEAFSSARSLEESKNVLERIVQYRTVVEQRLPTIKSKDIKENLVKELKSVEKLKQKLKEVINEHEATKQPKP